jgi:hypothetical protein
MIERSGNRAEESQIKSYLHITLQCRRTLFLIAGGSGGGGETERLRLNVICKFRVSEMPFPGLWRIFDRILLVRKERFSMPKFTVCLQISSTKWVKAYLINYILDKLQESMRNIFILCRLSWIMEPLKINQLSVF